MKILKKVWNGIGLFDSPDSNDIDETMEEVQEERTTPVAKPAAGKSKVVELSSAVSQKQTRVTIVEPFSFDDAQHIADHLKNRKSVVMNFENTEPEVAKRLVDFISGTTYALNGTIQKVSNKIFFCAPNNVDISYDMIQEEFASPAFMPWDKTMKDE